jgi:hypothetical protein
MRHHFWSKVGNSSQKIASSPSQVRLSDLNWLDLKHRSIDLTWLVTWKYSTCPPLGGLSSPPPTTIFDDNFTHEHRGGATGGTVQRWAIYSKYSHSSTILPVVVLVLENKKINTWAFRWNVFYIKNSYNFLLFEVVLQSLRVFFDRFTYIYI